MSKPKESYLGREVAVLRRSGRIAQSPGSYEASTVNPGWSIVNLSVIMEESDRNLKTDFDYFSKGGSDEEKKFYARNFKMPTGSLNTNFRLSFHPEDLAIARNLVALKREAQERQACEKKAWTEYLMQPGPHVAEEIVNFINVSDSATVIRTLAKLDMDILSKVRNTLKTEQDAWYAKVSEPATENKS